MAADTPDRRTEARRLVVIGASQATGYGLQVRPDVSRRSRAFPALLHADPSGDFEVLNLARDSRNIDEVLPQFDELVAWRPEVVVCISGGREALVRRNAFVARHRRAVPVKGIPQTPSPRGVEWLRSLPWRSFVWLVKRESRTVERLAARLKFGPEMPAQAYSQALTTVVQRVMTETSAHVLLLPMLTGWIGEYPWWPHQRAANRRAASQLAADNPRVTVVLAQEIVSTTELWLKDGAHQTETGHAALADLLAGLIRELPRPSPAPSDQ